MLHLYSHHIHVTFRIPLIHYPLFFCLVKCVYRERERVSCVPFFFLSMCIRVCMIRVSRCVNICLFNENEMLFSLNTNYQHGSLHRIIESLGGGFPEEFARIRKLYFYTDLYMYYISSLKYICIYLENEERKIWNASRACVCNAHIHRLQSQPPVTM